MFTGSVDSAVLSKMGGLTLMLSRFKYKEVIMTKITTTKMIMKLSE